MLDLRVALLNLIQGLLETNFHLTRIAEIFLGEGFDWPRAMILSSPNRYTEHQARRLISALEGLDDLPGVQELLPKLHAAFELSSPYFPGNSPPHVEALGAEEAMAELTHAMGQLHSRHNTHGHTTLSSLLLKDRAGSYGRTASTSVDYDGWLVSGWAISKKTHGQHVDGVFELPTPLPWHRNSPGLASPDGANEIEIAVVPLQEDIPYNWEASSRCSSWQPVWVSSGTQKSISSAGRPVDHMLALSGGALFVVPQITTRITRSRCLNGRMRPSEVDVLLIDMTSRFRLLSLTWRLK
jgi:hypothetical protein